MLATNQSGKHPVTVAALPEYSDKKQNLTGSSAVLPEKEEIFADDWETPSYDDPSGHKQNILHTDYLCHPQKNHCCLSSHYSEYPELTTAPGSFWWFSCHFLSTGSSWNPNFLRWPLPAGPPLQSQKECENLKSVHHFVLLVLISILGLENPFKVFPSQAHYILHLFHCLPPTNGAPCKIGNSKHSPKLNRSTKGSKVPLHLTQPSNCCESFWSTIKLPWLETHEPLEVISLIQLTFPRSWRLIV
ncbi:hypothetical protein PanWU01x14_344190 [Parasponia andersonii]|uniref:Uncharacterized protein n=1 Tax=Parasponia andersonii TaxID=3476 RepID=A0A2P5AD66_PARAD|nr:hypothetical protein PanWU01x14_344190 [Parasponia andersonii]